MTLQKRLNGQVCEFILRGDFGYEDHPAFRDVLDAMAEAGSNAVVLNMADVSSIDSAALGMLMLANKEAGKNGKSMRVVEARGTVGKILEMVKFEFAQT